MDIQFGDRVTHPDWPNTPSFTVIEVDVPGYDAGNQVSRILAEGATPNRTVLVFTKFLVLLKRKDRLKGGFARWVSQS